MNSIQVVEDEAYQPPNSTEQKPTTPANQNKLKQTQSVFFYQPLKHQNLFGTMFYHETYTSQYNNSFESTTYKESSFRFVYEFGVINGLAIGIKMDYGYSTVDYISSALSTNNYTNNFRGMGDIILMMKVAQSLTDSFSLFYGTEWGINNGKWEWPPVTIEYSNGTQVYGEGNRSSGGMSLYPYFGFQWNINSHHAIGAKLSYLYLFERIAVLKTSSYSNDIYMNGKNILSLQPYYELGFDPLVFDLSFGINQVEKENWRRTYNSINYYTDIALFTEWFMAINGRLKINPSLHILAKFQSTSQPSTTYHFYSSSPDISPDTKSTLKSLWRYSGFLGFDLLF